MTAMRIPPAGPSSGGGGTIPVRVICVGPGSAPHQGTLANPLVFDVYPRNAAIDLAHPEVGRLANAIATQTPYLTGIAYLFWPQNDDPEHLGFGYGLAFQVTTGTPPVTSWILYDVRGETPDDTECVPP